MPKWQESSRSQSDNIASTLTGMNTNPEDSVTSVLAIASLHQFIRWRTFPLAEEKELLNSSSLVKQAFKFVRSEVRQVIFKELFKRLTGLTVVSAALLCLELRNRGRRLWLSMSECTSSWLLSTRRIGPHRYYTYHVDWSRDCMSMMEG